MTALRRRDAPFTATIKGRRPALLVKAITTIRDATTTNIVTMEPVAALAVAAEVPDPDLPVDKVEHAVVLPANTIITTCT